MAGIAEIHGIDETRAERLRTAGVRSLVDLVASTESNDDLRRLAETVGVSEAEMTTWAASAGLMQVAGVGAAYAQLLVGAGVGTVDDLAYSRPRDLARRVADVSAELGRPVPNPKTVALWIAAAHEMLHRSFSKDPDVVEI